MLFLFYWKSLFLDGEWCPFGSSRKKDNFYRTGSGIKAVVQPIDHFCKGFTGFDDIDRSVF